MIATIIFILSLFFLFLPILGLFVGIMQVWYEKNEWENSHSDASIIRDRK